MTAPNLLELFVTESDELLRQLEHGLLRLEEDPPDTEVVHQVFRAAHTIKGGAGMLGLDAVVEVTHVLEGALDRLREGRLAPTRPLVDVLLRGKDVLDRLVATAATGAAPSLDDDARDVVAMLRRYLGVQAAEPDVPAPVAARAAAEVARTWRVSMAFRPDLLETGQDPLLLLRELAELGEVLETTCDTGRLPSLEELDPTRTYLGWDVVLQTTRPRSALDNVFLFVADENRIVIEDVTGAWRGGVRLADADRRLGDLLVEAGQVAPEAVEAAVASQKRLGQLLVEAGAASPAAVAEAVSRQEAARAVRQKSSIRVDTDKLDRLVNLVGEMVIAIAQINRAVREPGTTLDERLTAVDGLDQIGRDLQEQVMAVRMVPVEELFLRFRRVVRDLAQELGKQACLETEGTQTELDKNVIEHLADPLKHLVRNCVDHGLESPEVRRAAGKDPEGRVRLRAAQQEGNIVIEVSDDGAGIDRDLVLRKARDRGLLPMDGEPTDAAVFDVLFAPGFSTAAAVTDISGRGVGLDVVRRNISELRGAVTVRSSPGLGTTFRVTLPLTLAIVEGMTVRVGAEAFTVPLLSIVEQLRPRAQDVHSVQGRGEVVAFRGGMLPLLRLHRVFGVEGARTDPTRALVMVIDGGTQQYAVLVDEVLGQEQAVIKSLADNFRQVEGIAGATILGDGRVSLILDVRGLERIAGRAA